MVVSGLVLTCGAVRAGGSRKGTRVTTPEEIVAAYVWDHAEAMQLIRYF